MSGFFLADDLSGALDAAAAFHRVGRTVRVDLQPDVPGMGAADIVGITTETRNASPADAQRRVHEIIMRAAASGGRLLYKKIDSTLRGPVVAELAALLEARPHARVLFTPANPRVGRTVRDGVLCVHGRPVAETEFARDPVWPVRESSIRALLAALPAERVVIADATTEDDLRAAVARMEQAGGEWVGVGSGALAGPVAEARLGRGLTPPRALVPPPGKVLMICGSAHPANRPQAEQLRQERGVPCVALDATGIAPAVQQAAAHLRSGEGVTLLAPADRIATEDALRLTTAAALQLVASANGTRLFITGGETGYAVCAALGISALRFVDEIEPGVALATAELAGKTLLLAMKPGGFGDASTWVRVWDALTRP